MSHFSSAVAAHLALYSFTLKTTPPSAFNPNLKEPILEKLNFTPIQASQEWERGVIYANAQNFARTVSRFYSSQLTTESETPIADGTPC